MPETTIAQFQSVFSSANAKLDEIRQLLYQVRWDHITQRDNKNHMGALQHVTEKLEEVAELLRS